MRRLRGLADLSAQKCLALEQLLPRTGQFRGPLLASGCWVRGVEPPLVKSGPSVVSALLASGLSKLIQRTGLYMVQSADRDGVR